MAMELVSVSYFLVESREMGDIKDGQGAEEQQWG